MENINSGGHGQNIANYSVRGKLKDKTIIVRILFLIPSKISPGYILFGYFQR